MALTNMSPKQSFPYYGGGQVPNPANVITATIGPSTAATVNAVGTIWVNQSAGTAYIAVKNTGINGTVTWDQLGLSTGTVGSLTGDSGGAITPLAGNITLTGGTGLNTVGTANTITYNVVGGGFKTVSIAGTSQSATVNTRYICTAAGQTTITLPAVAAVGDALSIIGNAANTSGWKIAQNASGVIHFPGGDTTVGVTGTLTSNTKYDCIELVCTVANNEWSVQSLVGTPTRA